MKRETQYQKIAKAIASQIKNGVWKVGDKLPSLRAVSHENGVSLNTAIQAYYELEKEGYFFSMPDRKNRKSKEINYSKKTDFTECLRFKYAFFGRL